ncbi:MAG: hypothetical protein U0175_09020 [Caldilineaceae bacterium]
MRQNTIHPDLHVMDARGLTPIWTLSWLTGTVSEILIAVVLFRGDPQVTIRTWLPADVLVQPYELQTSGQKLVV